MVLDELSKSLKTTIKRIANAPYIDSKLIKSIVRDIQRAFIMADVNIKLVFNLSKEIERRALSEKPLPGMSSREHVIKIVYEEIVKIIGETKSVDIKKQKIMLVGLYGQGKTTTCAKLALYFQKRGLKSCLIASDIHRPAAYEQLKQLGESINVPVYGEPENKNIKKLLSNGLREFSDKDVIIVDTSGRHSLEKELIDEMKVVAEILQPDEKILIIDATMGQNAGMQAKAFHEAIGITGVIISKLDGSAKGGGAISAVAETNAPLLFIGTGEKLGDIEKFEPTRFISRLIGMGDIQSLLEKVQETMDSEKMERTARKIMSGKFTLKDMYEQMEMVSKMGPLRRVMDMLPFGMTDKIPEEKMRETQEKLKKFRIIMDSMTEEEKNNPQIIKSSRVKRIARGSGTDTHDVRELLKYYNMSKKAIKGFTGNRKMRRALMKQLRFT